MNHEIVRSDIILFGKFTKRGREILELARLVRVGELELVVVVECKTKVFKKGAMRMGNQRVVSLVGSRRMGARRTKRRGKRSDEVRIDRVELIIRRGREGFDRNVVRMSAITKRGELKNR